MEINVEFNNGFSGGPVVDYTGKVVGIATGQLMDGKNPAKSMGVAVPINEVRSMIGQAAIP